MVLPERIPAKAVLSLPARGTKRHKWVRHDCHAIESGFASQETLQYASR